LASVVRASNKEERSPLPQPYPAGLIRIGILALPIAGLLALVGLLANYSAPDPRTDPGGAARVFSSTGYFASQFVGNVLGFTLLIFGVIILAAYLANTSVKGLALGAMVLSLVGIALVLSVSGVAAYALPVIGRAYLDNQQDIIGLGGQQGARSIVVTVLGSPAREIFILVFFVYSSGFILFGIAIWRSGILRKGSAIPIALHAPLFSSFIRPQPNWTSILGALLFILGSGMIAAGVLRRPAPGEEQRE
jgi:hypothetical protein